MAKNQEGRGQEVGGWTPGPWIASQQTAKDGRMLGMIVEARHRGRSRIGWPSLAWADTNEGADPDHPENVANAHLIAAAPTLYEALEAARPWLLTAMAHRTDAHPQAKKNHDEDVAKALGALRLARGESQP